MSAPFLLSQTKLFSKNLQALPAQKLLINTLNAHCFNIAQKDKIYAEALSRSDVLLPDGISVVFAARFLTGTKLKKIAGADLFFYEMNRLNIIGGSCFFLGSNEYKLKLILDRTACDFPNVRVQTYSPPFTTEFSTETNAHIVESINTFKPDVLFIGMTAPKQEKWAYSNLNELETGHICCIGAVFDFYAGTVKRAPQWMIGIGLEWLHRLLEEPSRLWRRYLIGNSKFIWLVFKEKLFRNTP
jgi:N-acetylglucosaminyldiphosphoundecaprenol N-acetyl-beta-D-mannosaminyltransferase